MGSIDTTRKLEPGTPALVIVLVASVAACALDDRDPDVAATNRFGNPFGMQGNGGVPNSADPGQGGGSGASGMSSMAAAGSAPLGAGGATAPVAPGTPGSGGTGAPSMGGAGAAAPSDCTMSAVGCIGMGVALTPFDGWVEGETNGLGIQGSFFVGSDVDGGGSSTVTPNLTAENVCVSGIASQVGVDMDGMPAYLRDWGVVVGFALAQLDPTVAPSPWSPSTPEGSVRGFSFVLMGQMVPPGLRFAVQDGVASYCGTPAGAPGVQQDMLFAGLATECWNPGFGVTVPSNSPLYTLQWSIPTNEMASVPFSFCIVDLQGIIN